MHFLFFLVSDNFIYSLLSHSGLSQLGADKACVGGPVGQSQHLPTVVSLSHWPGVALCCVTAPWTSVAVAVSS